MYIPDSIKLTWRQQNDDGPRFSLVSADPGHEDEPLYGRDVNIRIEPSGSITVVVEFARIIGIDAHDPRVYDTVTIQYTADQVYLDIQHEPFSWSKE